MYEERTGIGNNYPTRLPFGKEIAEFDGGKRRLNVLLELLPQIIVAAFKPPFGRQLSSIDTFKTTTYCMPAFRPVSASVASVTS